MFVKSKNNEIMLTFYLKSLFLTCVKMDAIHVSISEVKLLDYFFIISFDHVMPNFNKTMIYHFKTSRIPRRRHKGRVIFM